MLLVKTVEGHMKTRHMKVYVILSGRSLKPGGLSPKEYLVGNSHALAGDMKIGLDKMG